MVWRGRRNYGKGVVHLLEHFYDGLHRLIDAKRGEWATTGITNPTNYSQDWSLDALGNWKQTRIDLDGNGSYATSETELRTHDVVNEMLTRDLDGSGGNNPLDLEYDGAGNLREQPMPPTGTSSLVYTHDAWDRLVRIEMDDGSLHGRGEYEYNGLNWRTVKRCDSNIGDQTHALDQERVMYYSPSWQLLEERIDENYQSSSGVDRVQQYVWGVRYIDDIVLHRQDNNADGDYTDPASGGGIGGGAPKAADATYYHLTDAQFSTVAIIDDDAVVRERVTYSAYGRARHHWLHDVDGDGDADNTDISTISTIASGGNNLIGQANYRAECDLDRDGDVDSTDTAIATALGTKAALRYGELSSSGTPAGNPAVAGVGNQIGFDGYVFNTEVELYTVRFRWYSPELGRWIEKDPIGYLGSMNLYLMVQSNPVLFYDPLGLLSEGSAKGIVRGILSRTDKNLPLLVDPSQENCALWVLNQLYNEKLLDWGTDVGWGLIFAPIKKVSSGLLAKLGVGTAEAIINAIRSGSVSEEELLDYLKSVVQRLTPEEAKLLEEALLNVIKHQIGDALGETRLITQGVKEEGEYTIECSFIVTAETEGRGWFGVFGERVLGWHVSGTCRVNCENEKRDTESKECNPCCDKLFTIEITGSGGGFAVDPDEPVFGPKEMPKDAK